MLASILLSLSVAAFAPQGIAKVSAPPAALVRAGEAAENAFDAARASDWRQASSQMRMLTTALDNLPRTLGRADERARLRRRADALGDDVSARRRIAAMTAANEVTRVVADLTGQFRTAVPVQVMLLDYRGRQLEVGIAARRLSMLQQATADIRELWNGIRPDLERRGRTAEVQQFTDVVVRLEGAHRIADYVEPAEAELDAVDQLETAFANHRGAGAPGAAGTTITGSVANSSTCSAWLPSRTRPMPRWLPRPTTIRSAGQRSASSRIAS